MKDDWITLDEAVELIMQRTGMTRRQAKRDFLKHLAKGEVKTSAQIVRTGPNGEFVSDGRKHELPPEFWRGIPK